MFINSPDTRRFSGTALSGPAAAAHRHPKATHPETPTPESYSPEPLPPRADLLYLADMEHRPNEWLWPGRLAAGSVAVLSGAPGSGKTWVALAIAAALSKGHIPSPTVATTHTAGDAVVPPCTIVYASNHHVASDFIRPRFLSLGGDPARFVLLRGIAASNTPGAGSRPIAINDTAILEDALEQTSASLLILDPLHSFLAGSDRHRAHGAAHLFDNLAQVAERRRCCVLLVRHLRRRGPNSTAVELSAAVRTEFLVGSSPDDPAVAALVQTKSNLGPLAPSLGFRIDPFSSHSPTAHSQPALHPVFRPIFRWTGPSKLTVGDLQSERPMGAAVPRRRQAAEWLRLQLSDGPLTQGVIERAAQRDGESMITIRRAKRDIGVLSTKNTFDGAWSWKLPETPVTTPEETHSWGGNIRY